MPRSLVLVRYAVALFFIAAPGGHPAIGYLFPPWVVLVSVVLLLLRTAAERHRTP
jgi:hypothetical protein